MQFATGKDWNANSLTFRQDRGFAEFGKKLTFDETPVADGTVCSAHRITLHDVPNGNVQKLEISAAEFAQDSKAILN